MLNKYMWAILWKKNLPKLQAQKAGFFSPDKRGNSARYFLMDTGCTIGKPFIRLFGRQAAKEGKKISIPTTEMIGNSLRFKGERGLKGEIER